MGTTLCFHHVYESKEDIAGSIIVSLYLLLDHNNLIHQNHLEQAQHFGSIAAYVVVEVVRKTPYDVVCRYQWQYEVAIVRKHLVGYKLLDTVVL